MQMHAVDEGWDTGARDLARRNFARSGVAVVPAALDPEMTHALRREADIVEARLIGLDRLPIGVELADLPDGARRVCRIEPICPHSGLIAEIAGHAVIVGLAEQVLGGAVHLLEDKLISKPPGCATLFPPHQEWHWTMPLSRENAMVVVPLESCSEENGVIMIVPGSHHAGLLPHEDDIVADSHFDRNSAVPLQLAPGDLAVVSGGVVHFSGPNASRKSRRLLCLSYNAASEGDCYSRHRARWTGAYSAGR